MKIEVGLGGAVWNDEEKTMVATVLGTRAFDYLLSNSVPNENLLMAVGSDEHLQKYAFGSRGEPERLEL
jgi:hypothetical protein